MYNKKHGWLSGDDFLKNIAIILKKLFQEPENQIFRVFRDEFHHFIR